MPLGGGITGNKKISEEFDESSGFWGSLGNFLRLWRWNVRNRHVAAGMGGFVGFPSSDGA